MLKQITREAHRVPICLTPHPPPQFTHHPSHFLPLRSAISFKPLHLFMCLFIISSAVSELKRHLVVRTVINSLIPLPLSLALLSYPPLFIPSSSSQRTLFLLHEHTDRSSVALLSRFTPPPRSSFFFLHLPSTNSLPPFHSLRLCFPPAHWYVEGQVFAYVQSWKGRRGAAQWLKTISGERIWCRITDQQRSVEPWNSSSSPLPSGCRPFSLPYLYFPQYITGFTTLKVGALKLSKTWKVFKHFGNKSRCMI